MTTCSWILIFIISTWILSYHRAALSVWTISFLTLLILQTTFSTTSIFVLILEWVIFLALSIFLNIKPLRRQLFTLTVFKIFKKNMPVLSRTEREALEAGTITWEGDLFQGAPSWHKLLNLSSGKLTPEEQDFLNGPVEELCAMTDDWNITHNTGDISPQAWQFIKDNGFWGIIIPKKYGGKEFSATAHSAILVKLYGRSVALASTVNVPNSLGPAELLLEYGTAEQKNYYLPRLAKGEEIPCFALTNPEAGSDASSIPDSGIICRGEFEGKNIIGIRLNWNKRYITLAPVATVIGLAFKLYDPDHLLGQKENLGITCALIPRNTPGIQIGRRHLPLYAYFQNGPTQGKDVFIPLDWIIGGEKMAGQGWRMLVECLSAGRAISLPSSATGNLKIISWTAGAYARIRKQFHVSIGHFGGIQQALARIGGYACIIDSALKFTLSAIDRGSKPAVSSAILKYHSTQLSRLSAIDSMDIHAGKGICLGPKNYVAASYITAPIGITVEGANILTRNLIIFGQGAIRCHPYILKELEAARDENIKTGLKNFDKALFGHLGYSISNLFRSVFLNLTSARFVLLFKNPKNPVKRYFQLLTRYSSSFALLADISMLTLQGSLKRRENLSARLGDILSMMYLASAVLKNYADNNYPEADKPLIDWSCQWLLLNIQKEFDNFLRNFPNRILAGILKLVIFPYGKNLLEPSDILIKHVAEILQSPNPTRDRLTHGIYTKTVTNNPIGLINQALIKIIAAEPIEKKLSAAANNSHSHLTLTEQTKLAVAMGVLSQEEAELVLIAEAARKEIIAVDDFASTDFVRQS